jgi:hypothetical protein
MGQSYRIRTELGINKSIDVQLDQEFEFLEILSLKIQQADIYTRSCSDYGVVVGRVTANNGFGLPNARVAVFIPIDSVDESNPLISSIYPYKSPTDKNEDGYRYNLLPYEKSYSTHAATGTLPTRLDALTATTAIEVYDKYYKLTAKTNDSGDYMIMGVPLGYQTLVMDVDLSDIGEFSLTPQDLIRMGLATEGQVAGNRFKTSTDLNSLPQIITLTKALEISPLWGEQDICDVSINRIDFDLRDSANVDIQPTSIFMGSLFSSPDDMRLRPVFKAFNIDSVLTTFGGKPKDDLGNLCELVSGPGQILAIRQTIDQDSDGNPILEVYQMEQSGNVIDGDGTWLTELPMNLDYFITNEFGEKVLSNDPTIGIPTKGKYRFKIKWQQPSSLAEQVRRAHYLVPNVKEYGHSGGVITNPNKQSSSYYFGLDWSGYTNGFVNTTIIPNEYYNRLNEVINCEDTFYEFQFNKVYTVASLIDEYKKGGKGQFIGIKEIGDNSCASSVNKFPVNEGVRNFDWLFFLFSILFQILSIVGPILLIVYHLVAYLWNNFAVILLGVLIGLFGYNSVYYGYLVAGAILGVASFGATAGLIVGFALLSAVYLAAAIFLGINFLKIVNYKFARFKLSMMTYPDCQACECVPEGMTQNDIGSVPNSTLTQFSNMGLYYQKISDKDSTWFGSVLGDDETRRAITSVAISDAIGTRNSPINSQDTFRSTKSKIFGIDDEYKDLMAYTTQLPLGERINVFNTRKKYFDGGGINQISVTFDSQSNGTKYHTDNTLTVVYAQKYDTGQLLTFINPQSSQDVNYLWTGQTKFGVVKGIQGTALIPKGGNITVNYASPLASNGQYTNGAPITYKLSSGSVGDGESQCVATLGITISANTDTGTITYNTCLGETKTINYPTLGVYTIVDTDCIDTSTLGGTANYTFTAGTTCQRSIYPSDIEYYQVVTALTVTEYFKLINTSYSDESLPAILNGQTTIYANYKETGLFGDDKTNQYDMSFKDYFNDFENQYVTILQRGVDPYSPLYVNKFGVGKLFGFTDNNVAGLTFTASTRINTPIQPIPKNGISVQNFGLGQISIFTPSHFFRPGVTGSNVNGLKFSSFTTNQVRYYGKFDKDTNPNPTYFNGVNSDEVNILVSKSNNLACDSSVPSSNSKYNSSEDLSGAGVYIDINFPYPPNGIGGTSAYVSEIFPLNYPYPNPTLFPNSDGMWITDNTLNVMRTDRLPSSDYLEPDAASNPLLQQNLGFQTYLISEDGTNAVVGGASTGASVVTADIVGLPGSTNALRSFNCETMVGLSCYEGFGNSFGIKNNCEGSDNVERGCYVFMNEALTDLKKDLKKFGEWTYRFRFFYGLCRGVLSQSFTNNWINGTLYAFPIQVNTFYDTQNNPQSEYQTDVIYFDKPTNNFYYRSSPYSLSSKEFVGQTVALDSGAVNSRNLLFPTTIINLGIKDSFYSEITFDPSTNGYIIPNLNPTSYSDTSDLINFFVISRITDENFLEQMLSLGDNSIQQLFSRGPSGGGGLFDIYARKRVDGDLAQLMSINSEIGNIGFSPEYYSGTSAQIIGTAENPTIAVWYSSTTENLQTKDYLTPGRINFRGENNNGYYPYPYGIKSQVVPFYQWSLKDAGTIFGSQNNNWATGGSDIVQNRPYQSLDRTYIGNYPYFLTTNSNVNDMFARGYIFSVDANGNYTSNIATARNEKFMVGAPFHFYFGTVKGASALDKFKTKYSISE